jgi:hypothetical protein
MSFHAPCDLCGGPVNLWAAKIAGWYRETFGEVRHYYPRKCIMVLQGKVKELQAQLDARASSGGK